MRNDRYVPLRELKCFRMSSACSKAGGSIDCRNLPPPPPPPLPSSHPQPSPKEALTRLEGFYLQSRYVTFICEAEGTYILTALADEFEGKVIEVGLAGATCCVNGPLALSARSARGLFLPEQI